MSLLSVVQSVTQRLALTVPNAVASSTDQQVIQLMALLNEEGEELAARTNWQALTLQTSFTTVATEIQGAVSTIAPGMKFIINETIWNRTLRRPVFGPLGPQSWQQMEAAFMQGPWNQYRIRGDNILFIPVPAVGQSCYFEYVTKYWCNAKTQSAYVLDADVSNLDEDVMTLGLIWRWKAAKGLNYAEDFAKYERRVADMIGRDTPKPVLNLGDTRYDVYPGVFIPAGSWGT